MRILSATVKNYRIHQETTVDLTDSLNLIGGPNESGKSTLVEAIHRTLFLKSSTGGEMRSSMLSNQAPGHPHVEVRFEAKGKIWQISKTFSGTSGKAILQEEGGPTLHGPEAESRLAEILQVEEAGGGRGGANKAIGQWAHLWVWQGSGGEDPSEHATSQRDALLSRLKEEGGGAVMQSDLDSRVSASINERFSDFFTASGKVKAGSLLQQTQEDLSGAEEDLEEAAEVFSRLENARRNFSIAEKFITSQGLEIDKLAASLKETRERKDAVAKLSLKAASDQRAYDEAAAAHQQMETALADAIQLKKDVNALTEQLKPSTEKISAFEASLKESKNALRKAEVKLEAAENTLTESRDRRELIEAWVQTLSHRDALEELNRVQGEAKELQKSRKVIDEKLAKLPPVDQARFRNLQQLESSLSKADAVLKAMSTGIEVVETTSQVKVGGQILTKGETHVFDSETLVETGDGNILKVTPGGGTSLDETRNRTKELRTALQTELNTASVESITQAGEVVTQRQILQDQLRDLTAKLDVMSPRDIESQLESKTRDLAAAESEVSRRTAKVVKFDPPQTSVDAKALRDKCLIEYEPLETQQAEAKTDRNTAAESTQHLEATLTTAKDETRLAENQLLEAQTKLQTKEAPLGSAEDRTTRLRTLSTAKEETSAALHTTQNNLDQLQPESLDADVNRFERALEKGKEEISNARQQRAVASSTLASDGNTDPAGALETAKGRALSAAERHQSIKRQADAIALLRDRFEAEQQKLSDKFSRPLADKVTEYLQQIFGPTAAAAVSFEEGVIGGWTMTRNGNTFDFSKLSGGTREQVAAAVRLAMAEILAPDHGGSLPVVFDDAFTNSDPNRIQSLQRMLDLAARHGLQIILLTCDPADYSALGAHAVSLGSQ